MNLAQQILADHRQANADASRMFTPSAPPCGQRQISFEFSLDDLGEVTVHCDYQPEERMTWHEPGCPEGADVTNVFLYDIDITTRCTPEEISAMEERALQVAQDLRDEADIDRYESRMDD